MTPAFGSTHSSTSLGSESSTKCTNLDRFDVREGVEVTTSEAKVLLVNPMVGPVVEEAQSHVAITIVACEPQQIACGNDKRDTALLLLLPCADSCRSAL